MKKSLYILFLIFVAVACNFNPEAFMEEDSETYISSAEVIQGQRDAAFSGLMELPVVNDDDIILEHPGYVISYNPEALIPEWVAYELTAEETDGEAERDDLKFRMDPSYRKIQAMREDYSSSGWTKGHMACAADFRWSESAMEETFYLTNICPQSEDLNGGDWNYLEKQTRRWARENGKVWVVSGPVVGDNVYGTIGERKVVVPDAFFKALLVERKGEYHSIAFVMNNDSGRYYLSDCSMSVNDLEKLTGLDFFPSLDDKIEEKVESAVNLSVWGIRKNRNTNNKQK